MKAIIAAGGSGTRLRPLTFSSNKHLLPIANKPLLLYPFEDIVAIGIKEIGVIVNETRPAVEALLGDGSNWGVHVTYILQEKPLGLAHVVKISQNFLANEPFIFHLGDNIFTSGIKRPFDHFEKTKPDALLTLVQHPENYRMGVPYFDNEGKLLKVVEKPENPPNKFGIPGLYFFNQHVFEAFTGQEAIKPSPRGELEITELYTYLLSHGYRVETEEIDGRWMDPGKFDDMLEANSYLLESINGINEGMVDNQSTVTGLVKIGKGTTIYKSQLTGPICIGQNVTIKEAVIGQDTSVGDGCNLEQVRLTKSVVMQNSVLKNLAAPIHNSLIGKNAEITGDNQHEVSLFIGDNCKLKF